MNLPSGRTFRLHVPEDYTPDKAWPLVFVFHGWKEPPENIEGYSELDAAKAIMVYPQGVGGAWSPAPYAKTTTEEDLSFVDDMVDSLRATYKINDSRIYAAGLSNGGGFAAYLACQMPRTFKSVATISAAYYEGIHQNCSDQPVGRLDLHGTEDPVVSYYGGTRHGARYFSVEQVLAEHERRNKCTGGVEMVRLTNDALQATWQGCAAPLQHIRIAGGSHVWPGGLADKKTEVGKGFATDRVLDFFGIPGRPEGTIEQEEVESTVQPSPAPAPAPAT